MLPISAPILIVSVIWMFTNIWNDFLFGSAYAFGSNAPIMVALNNVVNTSRPARSPTTSTWRRRCSPRSRR